MRRMLATLALGALALGPLPSWSAEELIMGTLGAGDFVFWDGPYLRETRVPSSEGCGVAGPCFDYGIDLVQRGERLRVAIDLPARDDYYRILLSAPDGTTVSEAFNFWPIGDSALDMEVFAEKPALGMWTVRVVPFDVTSATFRMRAKLEMKPVNPARPVALLPNLQAIPPYEFTFTAPANPANGTWPPDYLNPPLDVAGAHPVSCTADETADDGASRCLRFTAGPQNAGAGPLDLWFRPIDDAGSPAPVIYQRVHFSNGKTRSRPAGTYEYHATHGHFHYAGILAYEVFRVTDRERGAMVRAGAGRKTGFCPSDQLMADWEHFVQDPPYSQPSNCGYLFLDQSEEGTMGLSTGWGDFYRWQRPGQYVEFGDQGDGYYVLRATVDKANRVLESDETDNTGYTLIKMVGDTVRVLERGRGSSPWDRRKVVVPD